MTNSIGHRPPLARAFVAALFLALAGCSSQRDFVATYPSPHDFPIHGVDVSKYQGDIDWRAAKDSGVQFAWIKATEGGDHADEKFPQNWEGTKAIGIPRGAYHFVGWCSSPAEQISWFEANVPVDPQALPPMLDVEATPTSKTCPRHLTRETVLPQMRSMLAELERHYGKRPVIYTTVDFYQAILAGGDFSDYPIWVRSTKYFPTVKYGARKWHFWQFQSDSHVAGIQGKVDSNAFFGDSKQWQAFVTQPFAAAPPVEFAAAAPSPSPLLSPVPTASLALPPAPIPLRITARDRSIDDLLSASSLQSRSFADAAQ